MQRARLIKAAVVTLGLAAAMHFDWHAARPTEHHLSLGLQWHWLLAVPVFGTVAWYALRAWLERPLSVGAVILGIASILAAVVEPAWEYWVDGASLEWTFGRLRLGTFAAFLATGMVTYVAVVVLALRRRAQSRRVAG